MEILGNLGIVVPIANLNDEQKRILILSWVAKNLKIRWKDYNIEGVPTAHSARINIAGRGGKNQVPNQIKRLYNLELDKDTVAKDIINFSLQVLFNMFTEIDESDNLSRRSKYMKAMDNPQFLSMLLQISIILTAKHMINDGQDIKHKTLEVRLEAAESKKRELTNIWKKYSLNNVSFHDAIAATEEIFVEFENQIITASTQDHDIMVQEKALLELVGDKNTEEYAFGILEEVRERFKNQKRLFYTV